MILTCPECRTRYQTDQAQFPPEGRKVRCAKCGQVWLQTPPEPEPSPTIGSALPLSSISGASIRSDGETQRLRAPSRTWAERLGLLSGWVTLGAILVLIGWTGFRFRQEIATVWPQSSVLFATFGVAADPHGLAIDGTSYRRETEYGRPVLVVTGRLVNRSSHELRVPAVRVGLTGGDRREIYHWTVRPPQKVLEPGQSLGFSARIPSPPPGARQVQLGFAGRE